MQNQTASNDTAISSLPPAFNDQDELQELATLSPTEIIRAEADLHGITAGLANLRAGEDEDEDWTVGGLRRLEAELGKIPASQKSVYIEAIAKCPEMVTDEHKTTFLERDGYDARLAARRIVRYWETKLSLFGPEKCFLPLTLSGAMKDEVAGMVKYSPVQVLPARDTAERAIILVEPGRRDLSKYSTKSALMALWYMIETATEDPEVRKRGVNVLMSMKDMERKHFDPAVVRFIGHIFWEVSPVPCRSIHMCHPNPVACYVVLPIFKFFIGKERRLRMKLHYGTTEKVLRDLEGYCLPRDRVPSVIGGDLDFNVEQWVNNRLALETGDSHPFTVGGPDEEEVSASTRRPKRTRHEDNHTTGSEKETSAPLNTGANSLPVTIGSSLEHCLTAIKRPPGRSADPRMNRAVMAKLTNPDMPLYEALVAGGFNFPNKTNVWTADYKVFDEDGVSLKQHKNQLNRRLRQTKKKIGQETWCGSGAMPIAPSSLSGAVLPSVGASHKAVSKFGGLALDGKIGMETRSGDAIPIQLDLTVPYHLGNGVPHATMNALEGCSINGKTRKETWSGKAMPVAPLHLTGSVQPGGGAFHDAANKLEECTSNARCAGKEMCQERRDSFYDSIVELPGIEDLPNH